MTVKSNMSKQFAVKSALRLENGGGRSTIQQLRMRGQDIDDYVDTGRQPGPAPAYVSPLPDAETPASLPADTPMEQEEPGLLDRLRNMFDFAAGGAYTTRGPNPLLRRNPDGSLGTPVNSPGVSQRWMDLLRGAPRGGYESQRLTAAYDPRLTRTVGIRAADGYRMKRPLRGDTTMPEEDMEMARGGVHTGPGRVTGPGGPREDKVPAMYSDGEYVLPAKTVDALGGPDALDELVQETNDGRKPLGADQRSKLRMQTGGMDDEDLLNPYNRPRTALPLNPRLQQTSAGLTANPQILGPRPAPARDYLDPRDYRAMAPAPAPASSFAAAQSPAPRTAAQIEDSLYQQSGGRGLRDLSENAGALADYNILQQTRGNNIRVAQQPNGVLEFTGANVGGPGYQPPTQGLGTAEDAARDAALLDRSIQARLASGAREDLELANQLAVTPEQRAAVNAAYGERDRMNELRAASPRRAEKLLRDRATSLEAETRRADLAERRSASLRAAGIQERELAQRGDIAASEAQDRAEQRQIDREKNAVALYETQARASTTLANANEERRAKAAERLDKQIATRLVDPATGKPDPAQLDSFKEWLATADQAQDGFTVRRNGRGVVVDSVFDLEPAEQERAIAALLPQWRAHQALNLQTGRGLIGRLSGKPTTTRYDPVADVSDPEFRDILFTGPSAYLRSKIGTAILPRWLYNPSLVRTLSGRRGYVSDIAGKDAATREEIRKQRERLRRQ